MTTQERAYLHILGTGDTKPEIANNRGHLFEYLICHLLKHLKIDITELNKSKNGTEIDIVGSQFVNKAPVLAECKAQKDPLTSEDIQKFGFKFLREKSRNPGVSGFVITLSRLNTKAKELWDDLKKEHGDTLTCYEQGDVIELLVEHTELCSPIVIRHKAQEQYQRKCGDTQLLCVENGDQRILLFWAQLLMSSDGTEPNCVAFFTSEGSIVAETRTINNLLKLKPDFITTNLTCLNLEQIEAKPVNWIDDVSPTRTVVRVRMSKDWFDYRFPSAPEFFVGRNIQRSELAQYINDVRSEKTSLRGVFFSGKSGIGKSSLALKSQQELRREKVILLPIDCRLCDDISFLYDCVNELLLELRQISELRDPLQKVMIRGLDSLVETLTDIDKATSSKGYYAILFFDQFERIFDFPEVTKTIRTLFLSTTERQLSILFGFAWKSDLWSQAEGFPHSERDDIVRETYAIRRLQQFDQNEAGEILKQLEIQWGERLSDLIKRQLATFSRGLPWLLKKVCAHVLTQKTHGVTQNELLETNLKLQDLFEADLAGLDDEERSLLRAIAPILPATLRRLSESFEIANIDRSLHRFIDKRILVKITEDVGASFANVKYDAYSDIFREFLITGTVPIENAYYFFTYPKGALNFFEKVKARGSLPIQDEISETGKQMLSIYNLSRDLRQLGLVDVNDKIFTVNKEIYLLSEESFLPYLQSQLKQNRLVSLTLAELNTHNVIHLSQISELLRQLFPSVQAKEKTWLHYSKTTAKWLHEAHLAYYKPNDSTLHQVDDEEIFERIVSRGGLRGTGFRLPTRFKNAIVDCIETMQIHGKGVASVDQLAAWLQKKPRSIEMALSDNLNLGFIFYDETNNIYRLTEAGYAFANSTEQKRQGIFARQCENVHIYNEFVKQVEQSGKKGVSCVVAVNTILRLMNLELADLTIDKLSNILANWAEYSGLISRFGKLCTMSKYLPKQFNLLDLLEDARN